MYFLKFENLKNKNYFQKIKIENKNKKYFHKLNTLLYFSLVCITITIELKGTCMFINPSFSIHIFVYY